MKPNFLVFSISILCLAGCAKKSSDGGLTTLHPAFQGLSLDQALERAKAEDKLVMVDFYANWCGPCRQLDAVTWKDAKVQQWLGEMSIAIKIDVDKNKNLAVQYAIASIPALVFLRPDGTEAGRLVGFMSPQQFLQRAGELAK